MKQNNESTTIKDFLWTLNITSNLGIFYGEMRQKNSRRLRLFAEEGARCVNK